MYLQKNWYLKRVPEDEFQEIRIIDTKLSIGRYSGLHPVNGLNETVIENRHISRFHLEFTKSEDGELLVKDKCTTNGTYVNGSRIEPLLPIKCKSNDLIGIGWPYIGWEIYRGVLEPSETFVYKIKCDQSEVKVRRISGLVIAAKNGDIDMMCQLLQQNNVNVDEKDGDGYTALHWACDYGNDRIVSLLLRAGADVNIKDSDSQSPLIWACDKGHEVIVKILLKSNEIDINIISDQGYSALICSTINGYTSIVQLLLNNENTNVNIKVFIHKHKETFSIYFRL